MEVVQIKFKEQFAINRNRQIITIMMEGYTGLNSESLKLKAPHHTLTPQEKASILKKNLNAYQVFN